MADPLPPTAKAGEMPATVGWALGGVDYLRRLKIRCVEIQRLRPNVTPEGVVLMKAAMLSLAELTAEGMKQARLMASQAARDRFVEQMRKVIASSGTVTNLPNSAEPARASGVQLSTALPEWIFKNRLPRFMKKWQEGDPEWRLLQCAVKELADQTNIIGLAETAPQLYTMFKGIQGGTYDTKPVTLLDGQKLMSVAYQLGFQAIPVKALAAQTSLRNNVSRDHSIVRMTNAPLIKL